MVRFCDFRDRMGILVVLIFFVFVVFAGAANPTRSPSFFLGTADAG